MAVTTPPRAVIGAPHRPYRRGAQNAILGGVCGGLAIRLGVKERTVRIVFALLALAWGLGLLLYIALWLTLARSGEDESIAQRLLGHRRELYRVIIGLLAIVAILFLLRAIGLPSVGAYTWPFLLTLIGVAAVWHGASTDERHHLHELVKSTPLVGVPASRSRGSFWLRVVLGAILVFAGLVVLRQLGNHRVFINGTQSGWAFGSLAPAIIGTLILLAGVVVLLAPWWLATMNDLSGERRERVRVEERARVAAHLHDSVLQTLTLIERAAGDEAAVVRLARNQERELRRWLFDPDAPSEEGGTFAASLRALQSEIENDYGVRVELVTVGDCDASDDVAALVAAGREAVINAARWSGANTIAVYGEVETDSLSLFVRDQGRGFDVEAIPSDRQGIALSIRQRMAQRGGTVVLKSTPSAGTDVQLTLPHH